MQQVLIEKPGHYDQLQVLERPEQPVGPGQVRIAVAAAGINYADCVVRMGLYKSAREFVGWPITPGFEVAGTVSEVGEGVESFAVGDRVLAVTRFGGYCSDLVVSAQQAFAVPEGWSLAQAAGFPAVALTAWYALHVLASPRRGDRLLVHSASGGVGSNLVQLGRHAGCEVVGVVGGAHKVQLARELGASTVIDKSSDDLWARAEAVAPQGYQAVFDANGVATLRASYDHLAPTGRLIVYGFSTMLPRGGKKVSWPRLAWSWLRTPRFDPLDLTTSNRSVMGFNLSYMFDRIDMLHEAMSQLLSWAAAGVLRPAPTKEYPLSQVAQAHRDLESGTTVGKLVLVPEQAA